MTAWRLIGIIATCVTMPLVFAGLLAIVFGTIRLDPAEGNKRYPQLRRYDNYGLLAWVLPNMPNIGCDVYSSLGGNVPDSLRSIGALLGIAALPCYLLVVRARRRKLSRLMAANGGRS